MTGCASSAKWSATWFIPSGAPIKSAAPCHDSEREPNAGSLVEREAKEKAKPRTSCCAGCWLGALHERTILPPCRHNMKKCSKCGETKEISEFNKNVQSRDGIRMIAGFARRPYHAYNLATGKKRSDAAAAYRAANPEL